MCDEDKFFQMPAVWEAWHSPSYRVSNYLLGGLPTLRKNTESIQPSA